MLSSSPPAQPPTQFHQEALLLLRSRSNSGCCSLLVPPAVSEAVASAGSFLRSWRSGGDSPRRRPGASAYEWDSALSAPSRSRGGGGGRPAIPRLPASSGAASWGELVAASTSLLSLDPESVRWAGGAQVARATASLRRPGRPRDPAFAGAPDHGGQLRPRTAAAASQRRPPPAPAPPERTRGGSQQRAVTSFHGWDGRRGTERAAQRWPGNPYLSCGRELPTSGAREPGVREARR